jgi:hypothetical protein
MDTSVGSAFGRGVFFGISDLVVIWMGVVVGIAEELLIAARDVVGINGMGAGVIVSTGEAGWLMHPVVNRISKQRKKSTIAAKFFIVF